MAYNIFRNIFSDIQNSLMKYKTFLVVIEIQSTQSSGISAERNLI